MGVGVSLSNGVSIESYNFRQDIPALNESSDALNLSTDKSAMQAALKEFTCSADTTGDDILDAMNAAATHGTKASWGSNYYRKESSATAQGRIQGDIHLTLGTYSDIIRSVVKILPIAGDGNDALLDEDRGNISHILNAMTLTNATTKEELIKVAQDNAKNNSTIKCTDFIRQAATFDADGSIVIYFDISKADKKRSLRISKEIPMLMRDLPDDKISVNQQEWDVLRIVNIERFNQGKLPVTMVGALQDATDIRAKELTSFYSHTRPNGKKPFTAIKKSFSKGRTFAENIAMCQETAAEVMNSWMNSKGHRKNILTGKFTYLGVGVATTDVNHWVQMFSTGKDITAVASSTGSFQFSDVDALQAAYLICTSADGMKSYLPLDVSYMTKKKNQYILKLYSADDVIFTIDEVK